MIEMPVPNSDSSEALHQGLRQTLIAPRVPSDFRSQLMTAVHTEGLQQLAVRRLTLEREHALAMQRLNQGHVRLQRDTLAAVVVAAFTAGACASLALPWLQETLDVSGAMVTPLLAIVIGVTTGAGVWWDRFGRAR